MKENPIPNRRHVGNHTRFFLIYTFYLFQICQKMHEYLVSRQLNGLVPVRFFLTLLLLIELILMSFTINWSQAQANKYLVDCPKLLRVFIHISYPHQKQKCFNGIEQNTIYAIAHWCGVKKRRTQFQSQTHQY